MWTDSISDTGVLGWDKCSCVRQHVFEVCCHIWIHFQKIWFNNVKTAQIVNMIFILIIQIMNIHQCFIQSFELLLVKNLGNEFLLSCWSLSPLLKEQDSFILYVTLIVLRHGVWPMNAFALPPLELFGTHLDGHHGFSGNQSFGKMKPAVGMQVH